MSQTIIGFFDDQSEAQRALEQLQNRGISHDRIDISRGHAGAAGASTGRTVNADMNPVSGSERDENTVRRTSDDRTVDREGRNTNMFTDFFNNLFGGGSDNDDADRYRRVAERSGAIVTVHADSREEAERVAEILDECGAVDVDEKATQYGYSNTRGTSGMSERTNISDNIAGERTSSGSSRMRSRIFDRRIDDGMRLRGWDRSGDSGYGDDNMGSRNI